MIKHIMGQAISSQARRFTYCLIDDTSETRIGTGVAIQLGGRFFLATAGHVIENAPGIKALMHNGVAHYFSDFVASHYDRNLDIGLLEVPFSDSNRFEFLGYSRLCETVRDEQEIPVMVVGFPGQFCKARGGIDLTEEISIRFVRCDSLTLNTVVLPRSEWPNEGLPDEYGDYGQLVDGRDMLIDYRPEPEVRPFIPKTAGGENPPIECLSLDPQGMSGGGIWLAQVAEGAKKVSYADARLIGLQIGWHRTRNLLRGVKIGAWFDFVRNQFPDLTTNVP